jgi:hypothetical protein
VPVRRQRRWEPRIGPVLPVVESQVVAYRRTGIGPSQEDFGQLPAERQGPDVKSVLKPTNTLALAGTRSASAVPGTATAEPQHHDDHGRRND